MPLPSPNPHIFKCRFGCYPATVRSERRLPQRQLLVRLFEGGDGHQAIAFPEVHDVDSLRAAPLRADAVLGVLFLVRMSRDYGACLQGASISIMIAEKAG